MIIQAGLTLIIMFNWEKNKFFLQLSLVSKSHCVLSCVFCLFLHSICWRTNPLRPAEVLGNIDRSEADAGDDGYSRDTVCLVHLSWSNSRW